MKIDYEKEFEESKGKPFELKAPTVRPSAARFSQQAKTDKFMADVVQPKVDTYKNIGKRIRD